MNVRAANASHGFDGYVLTQGSDDPLDRLGQLARGDENDGLWLLDGDIDALEDGDAESGSLSRSGWSLMMIEDRSESLEKIF